MGTPWTIGTAAGDPGEAPSTLSEDSFMGEEKGFSPRFRPDFFGEEGIFAMIFGGNTDDTKVFRGGMEGAGEESLSS